MIRPLLLFLAAMAVACAQAGEWSGNVSSRLRLFPANASYPGQHDAYLSAAFEPQFHHRWEEEDQSFTFTPFIRMDQHQHTQVDVRELTWLKAAEDWELRLGVRKVFWGVAESTHLVDIINQTDLLESPDGEDKLGQPMVNFAWITQQGTIDFFLLPYFRERTFPSRAGRPRGAIPVDDHHARYASRAEEHHLDWAVRWSHTIDEWDVALSHFSGTSRDPRFLLDRNDDGEAVLIPYYDTIDQTGLEIQATLDAWLWKLEGITRSGSGGRRYVAAVGGFEYTWPGILDSDKDLGLIGEVLFDDRGRDGPNPFAADLMLGARLTFNDTQSTDLLAGFIIDPDSRATALTVEGSRRLGEDWKLSLEGRAFSHIPRSDPLFDQRRDHYLQVELARYF